MSEIKQKVKVKREHDDGRSQQRSPALSSPKVSNALKSSKDVKKEHYLKKELASPVKKDPMPAKPLKLKKDAENIKPPKQEPPAANKSVVSKTVKKEAVSVSISKASSSKDVSKKSNGSKEEPEKKERKVYSLPGQKHDPPDERDPLRIFYESLYKENPKSEMAEVWMMEHGLLGPEAAKKAFERKKKSQLNQKLSSPVKISKEVVVKSEKTSMKVVLKSDKKGSSSNGDSKLSKLKRKLDSDDDDDFILKPKKKLNTNS